MEPYVVAPYLRAYLHRFAASVSAASCDAGEVGGDEEAALRLKIVAVAAILVAGAAGVAIPLVGRRWRGGVARTRTRRARPKLIKWLFPRCMWSSIFYGAGRLFILRSTWWFDSRISRGCPFRRSSGNRSGVAIGSGQQRC